MGMIQSAIGGLKRMFGVRELTENYTFVKNYGKDVIHSELQTKSAGKKPLTGDPIQLQSTYSVFKKLCITYVVVAALAILYSLYNFVHHASIPGLLSLCFSALCLSLAFRYHFWMFQIRQRQLGCSLKEWFTATMGKGA